MPSIEMCVSPTGSPQEKCGACMQMNKSINIIITVARTLGGFNWCQRVALPKHNQPRQLLKLMSPREVANSLKESVLTLCKSPYEV